MKKLLLGILTTLNLAGCGGGGGSSVDLTGNWTGTATGVFNGQTITATARLTLAQSGDIVKGTFSSSSGNSGTVEGTVTGSTVTGNLFPSVPTNCPATFVYFYSNNTLSGQTVSYNCTVAGSSQVVFTR